MQGNRRALRRGESACERTDRLLRMLGDLGDHDLALAGCQENIPHMRFMDSDLTRMAGMAESMADADMMMRAMGRGGSGGFTLMKYLPALLLSAASPAASHQRYFPHDYPPNCPDERASAPLAARRPKLNGSNACRTLLRSAHQMEHRFCFWGLSACIAPPFSNSVAQRRVQLRWPKPAMDAKRRQTGTTQVLRDWIAGTMPRVQSALNPRLAVQVRSHPLQPIYPRTSQDLAEFGLTI